MLHFDVGVLLEDDTLKVVEELLDGVEPGRIRWQVRETAAKFMTETAY